ncbi:MAG: kelch repeat-containing protein [Duganella sp.]
MTTRSSAISKFLAATLTTALALGALSSCAHAGGEQSPSGPPASRLTPQWHSPVTANTPTARHENAFVAIGQKLYLVGGRGQRPLDIFDTATGTWRQGAAAPLEIHHMQALAHDGKLYIVGALTGGFPEETPLDHILIYDPASDRWSAGPQIPEQRRRGGGGVVAHEGRIYLVGGNTRGHMSGYVPWLDVFDPATGAWTRLPDAPHARDHFHAVVIDGQLYAAGGRRSAHDAGDTLSMTIAQVDVYDIAAGRWRTLAAPLPTPRAGAAVAAVGGKLLVMGGESARQVPAHSEVEAFDPASGRWQTLAPLPQGRHGTQATVVGNKLYLAAGSGNRGGGPELGDLLVLEQGGAKAR